MITKPPTIRRLGATGMVAAFAVAALTLFVLSASTRLATTDPRARSDLAAAKTGELNATGRATRPWLSHNEVASIFGPVKVNSTCRSRTHNAKIGGATHSKHLTGDAADFSVRSNKRGVLAYLQKNPSVGGLKLYGGDGHFHIDTGPRRTW